MTLKKIFIFPQLQKNVIENVKAGGIPLQRVAGHESLHAGGLSDKKYLGRQILCCSGIQSYLDNYNSLTPDLQVLNPD